MLKQFVVDRYLLRESVKVWLTVAITLFVLTVGMGFARHIAKAAAGELPAKTVLTLAGMVALENMQIVLPASLLLAIMIVVGRLCRDNEMVALNAGGVGIVRLYRPFFILAVVLAALAAWITLFVAPNASKMAKVVRHQGAMVAQLGAQSAGKFHTVMHGRATFYFGSLDGDSGEMHHLFVRVHNKKGRETIVIARRGQQKSNPDTGEQTLVLYNGWRYEGTPGNPDYRITHFDESGVRIKPPVAAPDYGLEQATTASLLQDHSLKARAELQHRIAVPVAVLLLALLALPLGYLSPRSGRYGKLIVGILVYVAYIDLLHMAGNWAVDESLPPAVSMWAVHGALFVLAAILLARRLGYLGRRRSRRHSRDVA